MVYFVSLLSSQFRALYLPAKLEAAAADRDPTHTSARSWCSLPTTRPSPSTMPSNRLAARLGQLPHNVLADLAARLCAESPALQAAAEECMAAHNPLPHEMVERVLLSPDLVPHILGPLEAEDGAAAAVCSQWLAGWKATNEPRRRLKQVPLNLPEVLATGEELQMAGTPDGRLLVRTCTEVHILDRSMRVLQTVASLAYGGSIESQSASSHDSIDADDDSVFYVSYHPQALHRSSHDGIAAAEYQLEGHCFHCPVLAPGGLLFCVMYEQDDHNGDHRDEIIALDAQTLQLRHRFGQELLNDARQLVVAGDEVYACDACMHRLQVFSLTGEHRRSITGEWRSPDQLCVVKDRLYLVEQEHELDDYEGEDTPEANPLQGRRILVLSLQGGILQVVTHPTEPTAIFTSICCFAGRTLLASYTYSTESAPESADTPRSRKFGMLALQGL